MSQFSIIHPSNKNLELVYGFDAPLAKFFYFVYDHSNDSDAISDDDIIIEDKSMGTEPSSLAQKLSEFGIPDHVHVSELSFDLPLSPTSDNDPVVTIQCDD